MHSAAGGAAQPAVIQSVSGEVMKIKNTFLDDWTCDESEERQRALNRARHTCPAFGVATADAEDAEPVAEACGPESTHEQSPERRTAELELPGLSQCCDGAAVSKATFSEMTDLTGTAPAAHDPTTPRRRRGGRGRNGTSAAGSPSGSPGRSPESTPATSPGSSPRTSTEGSPSGSSAPGRRCGGGRGRGGGASKLWCHLFLEPDMLQPGFELAKKIIGHGGAHTRKIFDATGAKIRLRGKGSGHLEGAHEAPVPIMLAVTTEKHEVEQFRSAVTMAAELLAGVEAKYRSFRERRGESVPTQGSCYWVGEESANGTLDELLPKIGLRLQLA